MHNQTNKQTEITEKTYNFCDVKWRSKIRRKTVNITPIINLNVNEGNPSRLIVVIRKFYGYFLRNVTVTKSN